MSHPLHAPSTGFPIKGTATIPFKSLKLSSVLWQNTNRKYVHIFECVSPLKPSYFLLWLVV